MSEFELKYTFDRMPCYLFLEDDVYLEDLRFEDALVDEEF